MALLAQEWENVIYLCIHLGWELDTSEYLRGAILP